MTKENKDITWEEFNSQHGELATKARITIENKVKSLLENKAGHVRFKEAVYIGLLQSEDLKDDLRGIEITKEGDMIFHIEERTLSMGTADDFVATIEELDMAALYEIMLAFEEKEIKIEPIK